MAQAHKDRLIRGGGGGKRTGLGRTILLWFGAGILLGAAIAAGRSALFPSSTTARPGGGPEKTPAPRPVDSGGIARRGFDLLHSERSGEAFEEFLRASRIAPGSAEPHLGLGEVYLKLGLFVQAEQAYRKAIGLDPTCWPAKKALAGILRDSGRIEESTALLEELDRDMPGTPFVQGELALCALRRGRLDEAVVLLEKYVAAEGTQAWGFAHLGRALSRRGDAARAEEALRRAVELNPKMGLSHLWLGQLLVASGRRDDGEQHLKIYRQLLELATQAHRLEQHINRSPDDARALAQLAKIRILLGQPRGALAALERALELSPGDKELLRLREGVLQSLGPRPAGP